MQGIALRSGQFEARVSLDGTTDIDRRLGRARRFLLLTTGFWSGPTKSRAWALTIIVVVFLFWNLLSALAVNFWTKYPGSVTSG